MKYFNWKFKYAAIFFCLLFCQNTVASKKPQLQYPNKHIILQAGDMGMKPWDHFVNYSLKANFNAAVFTKLLNIDADYSIKPGILKSWEWDNSDLSYTFTVDTSLKFDKKRYVKPIDVEFAIVKHFLSKVDETDKRLFYDIKGVQKLKKGAAFKQGLCPGIKQIGKNKIKIYLNQQNPTFLYTLGDIVSPISPVEDFKNDLFSFKQTPRGTGPYKVVWSDKKSSLVRLQLKDINDTVLASNSPVTIDIYNHGKPVENKIDIGIGIGTNGTRKNNPHYKFLKGKVPMGIGVLDFNYSHHLGKNNKFREAVSLAINRTQLFHDYKSSTVHHEMVPTMYYGRTNLKFEFNPTKAKKIVKKYFKNISSPKRPIKAMFHGGDNAKKKKYIIRLEKQLANVGLFFDFKPDEGVYFNQNTKDYVLASYGAVSSFVDPLTCFSAYLPGTASPNHTVLKDKKAVNLFKSIKKSNSKERRSELIKNLSQHFFEVHRQLPLNEIYQVYTHSKNIKSLNLGKSLMTINFEKVELNKKNSTKAK